MSVQLVQPIISVPLFLILTAILMGRLPNKDSPTTVTELYNDIISSIQDMEYNRNEEIFLSIINELKSVAFRFIEKETTIGVTQPNKFHVDAAQAQHSMSDVPHACGSKKSVLCHQSMQKFYAASFLAKMEFDEFSHYYEEHLHNSAWHDVRQFVAGIVYSKASYSIHQVSDREKKQEFISRSTLQQLEKMKAGDDRMALYAVIYETNEDYLMKNLSVIDVSEISLSPHEMYIIGSWIAKSGGLKYLGLWSCHIDSDNVAKFTKCLKQRIRVDHIDLRQNTLSAKALGLFLGLRRKGTNNLDWKVVRSTRANPDSTPSTRPLMSRHIKLTKEKDVIKIHDEEKDFDGRFHVKESKLVLNRVYWLGHFIYCSKVFVPQFSEIPDRLLYMTLDDLRELSEINIEEVNKILLDCTKDKKMDWMYVTDFVKKYQVKLLDIVVKGGSSKKEFGNIVKHHNCLSGLCVHVNIHWMFRVDKSDDARRMLGYCKKKKMDSVRCVVENDLTLDDILTLTENSKKLKLIYLDERHTLKGEESGKLQRISRDLGARLEVLCGQDRDEDAWKLLDFKKLWDEDESSSDES